MNWLADLTPLLSAVLLGGVVGFERQIQGHGAGLRTHMMVSLAAAIFVIAARGITNNNEAEMTRVIQGIAAGVGFIGAGTILKLGSQHEVLGLTTASTIWLAAAVGTASGLREYAVGLIGATTTVIFLVLLRPIENQIDRKAARKNKSKSTTDTTTQVDSGVSGQRREV